MINAQSKSQENQCGLNVPRFVAGHLGELVFVDVGRIIRYIDS